MRVIVIGARGPAGRAILRGLAGHPQVTHVVSLTEEVETTQDTTLHGETPIEQRKVDLFDDLSDHFKFADAAVYAGWPVSHLPVRLRERQMEALSNVCQCIGVVGVRVFVYGSSAGVYSSAPLGRAVDEAWPTLESTPSRQLSQLVRAERVVDRFEDHHPLIRVVRLRAGVIVCLTQGRAQAIGRKILRVMHAPHRWCFVPDVGPYALQCVHVDDFVKALGDALTQSVSGPFNIAADPITSDLLAELFAAKKLRLAPQHIRRILALSSRLRILRGPIDWAELAIRPQIMDTTRAERDLHWTIEHPARSIVAEWSENLELIKDRLETKGAVDIAPAPTESTDMDLGSLYVQALAYFGEKVHAIRDDQWGTTADEGLTVWQLVATIALDQYRVALAAHGDDDETIDAQLPGDPLGIAPADGWDLAAERGNLAVARPDGPLRVEDDFLHYRRLEELVSHVIVETVRGGSELGRVLGLDTPLPHELAQFTERMEPPGGSNA
jgi:nucleoside-diphosphate-sugar epimerase